MRQAGRLAADVLAEIGRFIKIGQTARQVNGFAENLIREKGGEPVFIGYRGYRYATCVSVNHEVVHGIPGERVLAEGDIVSVDVGVRLNGYCGDCAYTFALGKISPKADKLLRTGREALKAAIRQARAGRRLGDVSHAVEALAEKHGFSVVRDLYGHGIGRDLHEDPLVPNYGKPGEGVELKAGMALALEPMLNTGGWRIRTLPDGWTVVTEDGGLSCHFEHTVLITEKDPEVLTWSKTKM
ncbi:type I methionyl aminopeptidase [candidate division WOR-1 bacterium RIFCSPHIGHO2_01_FULL_53_15]|uniref:Methionine aminopeptidase n=1 Tax=candidate division WOR-1 bacterium RIFCSPHIGHO2_01_FULL_53_15 TaxID=1802564 RepID=A0A1F4Q458_UNCSA|nr:MAG: type I methionyl aminopeptidase [candidate division WOR-1 bacterium RIFCSPHIGHO2_01_FULL_53_15]OGC12548.1 MAG: type I methionyl aminopeptidase [candidate division WOR-1 bacterium RIFCSPHIGHO2_02_FULL_53_26]